MTRQSLNVNRKVSISIVIIIGAICASSIFGYYHIAQASYTSAREAAKARYEERMTSDVDNLIAEIDDLHNQIADNYKTTHGVSPEGNSVAMAQIDAQTQEYIHGRLDSSTPPDNQYFWITQVLDYSGGDKYAFYFAHQNLKEEEGKYLSTNTEDIAGNKIYATELAGIESSGEIYHSYYFKNLQDDQVELKYSYSKLYKQYNWIISTGVPEADMYLSATKSYKTQINFFPFFILLVSLIFIASVITTYVLYQNALNRQEKDLAKRQNSFKSDFLSNMSHDLRTPMNAIIGSCELAYKSNDMAEINMNLNDIKTSSDFLLSLINDILDVSAIEEGRLKLAVEPFDVKELVYTVSSLYQLTAKQKNIEFYIHGSDIHHEWLYGDIYRLSQIISNLLSNAFKFTDTGGEVSFDVSQHQLSSGKIALSLSVRDTGCGMTEKTQKCIFHKFEQADVSTVRNYGGSGLGLSIAQSLTDLMNGTIAVESTPGVGSKFTVSVELNPVTDEKSMQVPSTLDCTNILVVDNDPDTCGYLSNLISQLGAKATWFASPQQALHSAQEMVSVKNPYDCCILDMKMPEMDGQELARELRKALGTSPTFILLSGYNLDVLRRNYSGKDIDGFLQKPIFPSIFVDTLNHVAQNIHEPEPAPEHYDTEGLTVLVAEDNAVNARIACNILEKAGAQVDSAPNGQRACELYLNADPGFYDLILMDVRMPLMDGYEATRFIRSSNRWDAPSIPIYAMTANARREDVELSKQAGMNGHLTKPINIAILMATLQQVKRKSPKDFIS